MFPHVGLDRQAWGVPSSARIWLFDTERGVLIVSAHSSKGTFGLDDAVALGEQIASSLVFIDPSELSG